MPWNMHPVGHAYAMHRVLRQCKFCRKIKWFSKHLPNLFLILMHSYTAAFWMTSLSLYLFFVWLYACTKEDVCHSPNCTVLHCALCHFNGCIRVYLNNSMISTWWNFTKLKMLGMIFNHFIIVIISFAAYAFKCEVDKYECVRVSMPVHRRWPHTFQLDCLIWFIYLITKFVLLLLLILLYRRSNHSFL